MLSGGFCFRFFFWIVGGEFFEFRLFWGVDIFLFEFFVFEVFLGLLGDMGDEGFGEVIGDGIGDL